MKRTKAGRAAARATRSKRAAASPEGRPDEKASPAKGSPKRAPKSPKVRKLERDHVASDSEGEEAPLAKSLKTAPPPDDWEQILEDLREVCTDADAPPEVIRYQALLALMLSSMTKAPITHAAMLKLQKHGCTIDNILATTDQKLGELIHSVNFRKNKVKFIKKTTEILKNDYNGDIPRTVEDLCKLVGVGPKLAQLCMKLAWDEDAPALLDAAQPGKNKKGRGRPPIRTPVE